jgi:pimeloyl-ACP methyl ester carboxylesterase
VRQAKTVDELVRELVHVLSRHRVHSAHFIAHSFGTFVVAHLRHLYGSLIKSALLCDPVRCCHVLCVL